MDNSRTANELYFPGDVSTSSGEASFSSERGLLIAVAAAMIGLSNIIRFPALVGAHGGLVFIAVYGVCLVLIGYPLLRAELSAGLMVRDGKKAETAGLRALDRAIATIGAVVSLFVMSLYAITPGLALKYFLLSAGGGMEDSSVKNLVGVFEQISGNVSESILYSSGFILLSALIVMKGIRAIQWISKYALIGMLIIAGMFVFQMALFNDASYQIWTYVLHPDLSKISFEMVFKAVMQVLFSLSLGMGVMRAYASRAPENMRTVSVGFTAKGIFQDLGFSVLMCLTTYPMIYALGYDAGMGWNMAFVNAPAAFSVLRWGMVMVPSFYLLLLFGALTSAVSFLEVVAGFVRKSLNIQRTMSVLVVLFCILMLNSLVVLSDNGMVPVLLPILQYAEGNMIAWVSVSDWLDVVASYLLMPFCAILCLIRYYWLPSSDSQLKVTGSGHLALECAQRVIAPVLIGMCVLYAMGLLMD